MANKHSTQDKKRNINLAIILVIFAWLLTASITIPTTADYKDASIEVTINNPLLKGVTISDAEATAYPHTLFTSPFQAGLISSGTLKLTAETATVRTSQKIGQINERDEKTVTIILKKIPLNENEIAIKLYENNVQIQAMKIILPTEASK